MGALASWVPEKKMKKDHRNPKVTAFAWEDGAPIPFGFSGFVASTVQCEKQDSLHLEQTLSDERSQGPFFFLFHASFLRCCVSSLSRWLLADMTRTRLTKFFYSAFLP